MEQITEISIEEQNRIRVEHDKKMLKIAQEAEISLLDRKINQEYSKYNQLINNINTAQLKQRELKTQHALQEGYELESVKFEQHLDFPKDNTNSLFAIFTSNEQLIASKTATLEQARNYNQQKQQVLDNLNLTNNKYATEIKRIETFFAHQMLLKSLCENSQPFLSLENQLKSLPALTAPQEIFQSTTKFKGTPVYKDTHITLLYQALTNNYDNLAIIACCNKGYQLNIPEYNNFNPLAYLNIKPNAADLLSELQSVIDRNIVIFLLGSNIQDQILNTQRASILKWLLDNDQLQVEDANILQPLILNNSALYFTLTNAFFSNFISNFAALPETDRVILRRLLSAHQADNTPQTILSWYTTNHVFLIQQFFEHCFTEQDLCLAVIETACQKTSIKFEQPQSQTFQFIMNHYKTSNDNRIIINLIEHQPQIIRAGFDQNTIPHSDRITWIMHKASVFSAIQCYQAFKYYDANTLKPLYNRFYESHPGSIYIFSFAKAYIESISNAADIQQFVKHLESLPENALEERCLTALLKIAKNNLLKLKKDNAAAFGEFEHEIVSFLEQKRNTRVLSWITNWFIRNPTSKAIYNQICNGQDVTEQLQTEVDKIEEETNSIFQLNA